MKPAEVEDLINKMKALDPLAPWPDKPEPKHEDEILKRLKDMPIDKLEALLGDSKLSDMIKSFVRVFIKRTKDGTLPLTASQKVELKKVPPSDPPPPEKSDQE